MVRVCVRVCVCDVCLICPPHTQELDKNSVSHFIRLIYPKLESQLMLAKNVQLAEALNEIKIHEKDTSFLSTQCQYILSKITLYVLYSVALITHSHPPCSSFPADAGGHKAAAMFD